MYVIDHSNEDNKPKCISLGPKKKVDHLLQDINQYVSLPIIIKLLLMRYFKLNMSFWSTNNYCIQN